MVFIPEPLADMLYGFGLILIENDKRDIGKWGGGDTYIHHYQCGAILAILGGIGKHIAKARKQVLSTTRT